ncbi:MAG: peroxiredoxin [Acidobacteriota bacterium]
MMRILLAILMLVFPAACSAADLSVGDPAPVIRLQTDEGTVFDLQSRRGEWTVLYFYPKAGTPGCTTQACSFRDNIGQIQRLGAEIYGVSADPVSALVPFKKEHNLNFTLLADPELKAISAYGTKMPSDKMSRRWTFIIGPDLKIRSIEKDVDPVLDAQRVADTLGTLQGKTE